MAFGIKLVPLSYNSPKNAEQITFPDINVSLSDEVLQRAKCDIEEFLLANKHYSFALNDFSLQHVENNDPELFLQNQNFDQLHPTDSEPLSYIPTDFDSESLSSTSSASDDGLDFDISIPYPLQDNEDWSTLLDELDPQLLSLEFKTLAELNSEGFQKFLRDIEDSCPALEDGEPLFQGFVSSNA